MTEAKGMNFETFKTMGGWADKFRPFIEGEGMLKIYEKLRADRKTDMIVPRVEEVYRAFSACDPKDLKVIFYLQDPYPRLYKDGTPQACGIAMDCRNSAEGKLQPSLELWYDAIDRYLEKDYVQLDGYKRTKYPYKCQRSPNLDYLHEQGVMLLNTDLTCKVNKTSSHEGYWKGFQEYFLKEVLYSTTGIIYVLCGNTSHNMEEYINPLGNYIFKLEHPMAAGHRGDDLWKDKGIFSTINRILTENNGKGSQIFWDKKDWDFYREPPF